VFIFFSILSNGYAQEGAVAAGGDASNADGNSVSYSVGEVFIRLL